MKFRSPTDEEIHVASLMGHAARVGPEWRELPPQLHREAIMLGCITDNMTPASIAMSQQPPAGNTQDNPDFRIFDAFAAIEEEKIPADLNSNGTPNLGRLSKRVGIDVSREDAARLWAEYNASKTAA